MGIIGWFKQDGESRPISEKKIRDVTDDNDNPVTFATPLVQEEKELDAFGNQLKDEFENIKIENNEVTFATVENEKMWKEVEDEIAGIEKDKDMTLEDKTILLFKLYEDYSQTMPRELTERILADLVILDKQLTEKKKEEGLAASEEKLRSRIEGLKEKLTTQKMKTKNIPTKSTTDKPKEEVKEIKEKSADDFDDWEERVSLLIEEAEIAA